MGGIITVIGASEHLSGAIFSINLSAVMAAHTRERTVYIGADRDYSGSGDLMPEGAAVRYLEDLMPLAGKIDDKMLRGYFPSDESALSAVLFRTPDREHPCPLSPVIDLLARCFDHVILNAPSPHDPDFAEVLAAGDCRIILSGNDIFSLSRARTVLRLAGRLHLPYANMKSIVTGPVQQDTMVPDEILRSSLEGEPFALLPVDPGHMASAANRRVPAAFLYPDSPFTLSLKEISARLAAENNRAPRDPKSVSPGQAPSSRRDERDLIRLKERLHHRLVEACRERSIDPVHSGNGEDAKEKGRGILQEIVAREVNGLSQDERHTIITEILDEAFGLGCLESLLKDPAITEIMINGPERIYIEKKGKIAPVPARFTSSTQLRTVIDRIVSPLGRRVDESSPIVDARLADGSRVNVIIPPVSLSGIVMTIRKFSDNKLTMDDLIGYDSLSGDMASFLAVCVRMRKNILISGGTGSGKTTLLNILSGYIPGDERIVTIEDAAELRLPQPHVVSLESRPPSVEGTGAIPIRRLVINALRMRPDRIVVGECRGGETLDMLQAMNTGHDGSLTTIHANTPRDSISRMITLAMMAGTELPERSIREQIAAAIHIIVQVSRMPDGSRKIVDVSEVTGSTTHEPGSTPLFRFEQTGIRDTGVTGHFTACGTLPSFFDAASVHGFTLEADIFQRSPRQ